MFVAKNSNTFIFNLLSYLNIPTVKGLLGIAEPIFSSPGSKRTIKAEDWANIEVYDVRNNYVFKNHKYQRDKL